MAEDEAALDGVCTSCWRIGDCTVRAIAIVCDIPYDSAYELLEANGRKCNRGIRLRPLLEGALSNEYRFKWTAFPAIKGY